MTYFLTQAREHRGARLTYHAQRACWRLARATTTVVAVEETPWASQLCEACGHAAIPEPPILIDSLPAPVLTASLIRERENLCVP